jgi:hypothetical protein
MANLSTAMIRLKVCDEEYEEVYVDFDDKVFAQFRDKFSELSYQGGGCYQGLGCFDLAGRWAFSNNLGWQEEIRQAMEALLYALKILEIPFDKTWSLRGDYADMDISMDWCGIGEFRIFFDDYSVVQSFEDMRLEDYSMLNGIEIPEPQREGEDDFDYFQRLCAWELAILNKLDEQY